jgi:predicted branched-subunit amino acid permease
MGDTAGRPVTRAAWRGARAVAPLLIGVVPFGIVTSVAVVDRGLGVASAFGFSTLVFAGASQLAAIEVLGSGAPAVVAVGTVAVVNLRFVMYSAALSPFLSDVGLGQRLAAAYVLTDQAFAVSVSAYRAHDMPPRARLAYYLGAGGALWTSWQAATLGGVLLGTALPEGLPLDFALPLVFMVLLIPAVEDRATTVAAAVGGFVAVLAAGLPSGTGLLVGAAAGITAGVVVAWR